MQGIRTINTRCHFIICNDWRGLASSITSNHPHSIAYTDVKDYWCATSFAKLISFYFLYACLTTAKHSSMQLAKGLYAGVKITSNRCSLNTYAVAFDRCIDKLSMYIHIRLKGYFALSRFTKVWNLSFVILFGHIISRSSPFY